MFDTDGDGSADDEVTAYGATDGWRIRVVEDGVVSEALMTDIDGWAFLGDAMSTGDGFRVSVTDNDLGTVYDFEMDDNRCIAPVAANPDTPSD